MGSWFRARGEVTDVRSMSGGGGSAIPCGLLLLVARAKIVLADWLPEVRERALSYWKTLWAALSTIHRCCCALLGSRVMPVGEPLAGSMVQLPRRAPAKVYLKTLSVLLSLTTQKEVPSVTRSL